MGPQHHTLPLILLYDPLDVEHELQRRMEVGVDRRDQSGLALLEGVHETVHLLSELLLGADSCRVVKFDQSSVEVL